MATKRPFKGLSDKKINELVQSPGVRSELRNRARRILPRTKAIAFSANAAEFGRALRVVEGTRSGAGAKGGFRRTYARVQAVVTEDMKKRDRGAKLSRRQILRRGSNG